MIFNPINYDEPLFRPPSEAYSAILQITLGCSWNNCAFCEMYSSKKFSIKPLEQCKLDIQNLFSYYGRVKKLFLADGDAFVLSANKLIPILKEINLQSEQNGNRMQRISSYALPKNIIAKTHDELVEIRNNGLKLLYIGIETGDDELLKIVNKGETHSTTIEGIKKAHEAGIDTSIMIINGLGGKKYSHQHAINSAKIINSISPKFLSTLTLSMPFGEDHFANKFAGEYQQQTIREIFQELSLFIENINVKNIIFRSNHVSNNLNIEGILSRDKEKIIEQIEYAIANSIVDVFPQTGGMM